MDAPKQKIYKEYTQHLYIRALANTTVNTYSVEAKKFLAFIGKLEDVENANVMEYMKQYASMSASSKNLYASALRSLFTYLSKNGFYNFKNLKVAYAKDSRKLPSIMSVEEILKRLSRLETIAYFHNKWIDRRNYALVMLLYSTGMRVSEAQAFQMADIEDGFVRINKGKGQKDRYVPIAKKAVTALKEYVKVRPKENQKSFFISYKMEALSRVTIYEIVTKNMGVNPHALRHHFATHMVMGGADVSVVSELLGHSNIATTQIYTHVQKPHLAMTVNRCHPMAHNNKEVSYE